MAEVIEELGLLDRTVVVAVYGKGDGAPPVPSDIRDFGQVPGWTP